MRQVWGEACILFIRGSQSQETTPMIRTIRIGRYMTVQGTLLRKSACGRLVIRANDKCYIGYPVAA